MAKHRLAHYLQKFSYTRFDDDEFLLRPFTLKLSEETAFALVKKFVSEKKVKDVKYDQIHHEIFVKYEDFEINYLFTTDDDRHTILSISTYAKKKGITYKKLLIAKEEITPILERYIESK